MRPQRVLPCCADPAAECLHAAPLAPRREFQTPDEEMKKIVLKVVKQCVGTDGVEPDYIRQEVNILLPLPALLHIALAEQQGSSAGNG